MDAVEQLKQLCNDINTITGIKTVILDADMRMVYVHEDVMGEFCYCVRQDASCRAQCLRCDRAGLEQCLRTKQTAIYQCHMGLTEAVLPVMEEDAVIGYLRFGQMLMPGQRDQVEQIVRNCKLSNEAAALEALQNFPETTEEVLEAAIRLMTICAGYIRLKDILKLRKKNLSLEMDRYITASLADPNLGIESLCRAFGLSRSTLYNVSRAAFGVGITQHIRQRRVRRAVALLRQGTMSVSQVAEAVGISDAGYLTKLIKAHTGLTPKKLRQAT